MKVVSCFLKEDGSLTPDMTAEEFKNKKYLEYGITEEQVNEMWHKFTKVLIEGCYPGVKLERIDESD